MTSLFVHIVNVLALDIAYACGRLHNPEARVESSLDIETESAGGWSATEIQYQYQFVHTHIKAKASAPKIITPDNNVQYQHVY